MLNTLISAVPTPFKKDFSLDLSKIKTLYEYLLEKRIDGVLVNGTAGEGLSLSIEERMHTTEEWLKVIGEHKKFFVATNVSCESVEDAKNLARHAMANKVDAVFFHSPSFFKPISIDLLLECCSLVAAECYPVPFYFYHLPDFTGIKYRITDFVPKAKMFETLAGNSINIGMISTSEIKISVIIALADAEKAARAIHDAFGLAGK